MWWLCLLPLVLVSLAHADWLQYETQAPFLITAHSTRQIANTVENRGVVEIPGTITFPVIDGCPGRADWSRLARVTPPITQAQVVARIGLRCFQGQAVQSRDEVDRIVQQTLAAMPTAPSVDTVSLVDRAASTACARSTADPECVTARAAQQDAYKAIPTTDAAIARARVEQIRNLLQAASTLRGSLP